MAISNRNWVSILSLPLLACLPIACASETGDSNDPSVQAADRAADSVALSQIPSVASRASCAQARPGEARCFARVRTDAAGTVTPFATPSGFGPADLVSAYKVPSSTSTATIAIVDAFDDPNAEADLGVYRSQFGLPPCTTANGCFKKVNQNGAASPLPSGDTGWGEEISLDLDMASAICPSCKILLVEGSSASFQALATSVSTAAKLGAAVISNSYGGGESSGETSFDSFYNHPGIAVFASTGDNGFGTSYPATAKGVIGVGGTSLAKSSSSRGWAETAWSGAGSGCSSVEAKPSWQNDTGCTRRTVGDLSAVANPSTGVAVYDTFGTSGWLVFGGTSVSSPLVASIFASIGKGAKDGSFVWANHADFFDVTSGSNGSCGGSYLCTAKVGFDGPTGWGTPNATLLKAAP